MEVFTPKWEGPLGVVLRVAEKLNVKVHATSTPINRHRQPSMQGVYGTIIIGPFSGLAAGRGEVLFSTWSNCLAYGPVWSELLHEVGHAIFTEEGRTPNTTAYNETASGQDAWVRAVVLDLHRTGKLSARDVRIHHQHQLESTRPTHIHARAKGDRVRFRRELAYRVGVQLCIESGAARYVRGVLTPTWRWPTFTPEYDATYKHYDQVLDV